MADDKIISSIRTIMQYYAPENISCNILSYQSGLKGSGKSRIADFLKQDHLSPDIYKAANVVKNAMGQIDVIIHAIGIINFLPYIFEENEIIESLSLGADNSKSEFDLVTNLRIAEFKFVNWKGNDSMRLKNTFKDFYSLVEYNTDKRKCLFLTDASYFIKFLNGKRKFGNILSKDANIAYEFEEKYGNKYADVSEYYFENSKKVEISSMKTIAPTLFS